MKLLPLSVINISGEPLSLKIVFSPKITVSDCTSGKGPSQMENEKVYTHNVHFTINVTKISSINMTWKMSFNIVFVITWSGMLVFMTIITSCNKLTNVSINIQPKYSCLGSSPAFAYAQVSHMQTSEIFLL